MASVYSVLMGKLDAQIDSHTKALQDGANINDFAEYRKICGVIRGLNLAKMEIQDLAKLQREQDDDDA